MQTRSAFIIRRDAPLAPFGEPAREILVLNETLATYQDGLLERLGIAPTRVDEGAVGKTLGARPEGAAALVFREDLFFSTELLEEFIQRSITSGAETTRACLKKGVFSKQIAILQDSDDDGDSLAFPLYWCRGKSFNPLKTASVVIDVDEFFESGNFPPHMLGKDNFRYSVTTRPILAMTETIHIGLVNIAANFARVGRLRKPGFFGACKAIVAALTGLPMNKAAIKARALRALSHIHPSAEVHPTAVVEGSVIGPKAKIGAFAVVRFSVIGEGACIDDHAGIKFSVVGDGAYICNNCVVFFTTVYPGAFLISGPYQFSVFGRDSAIMNSIPSDYRLDGKTIKVPTSRGLEDTGLRFAGSIIGHETRIAAGLILSPGRAIPGGLTLYPDPARVLGKVEEGLGEQGQVWFLKDGRLTDAPLMKKSTGGGTSDKDETRT